MSILSKVADGCGFHYGYAPHDFRRIDARREKDYWAVYVAGDLVGHASDKEQAEACALSWMAKHPDLVDCLDD